MSISRGEKGDLPRGVVLGSILLVLFLNGLPSLAAPRPGPVQVYGGYSSISKSVTVTKRLEFHMNKDQTLDNVSLANDKDANDTYPNGGSDTVQDQKTGDTSAGITSSNGSVMTNSSTDAPQVNHSVQYSIETKSNVDGDLLPPMTVESVNNDLNEMQKMAKANMKKTEFMSPSDHEESETRLEVQNQDVHISDYSVDEVTSALDSSQSRRDNRDKVQHSDGPILVDSVDEATSVSDYLHSRRDYYDDVQIPDSSRRDDSVDEATSVSDSSHSRRDYYDDVQIPDSSRRDDSVDEVASVGDFSQPRRDDYDEVQNPDSFHQGDALDQATSLLGSSQSRSDFNDDDQNSQDSIVPKRRDEMPREPQHDALEDDVNEPFVTTFYMDQKTPSTATKEFTTAISEKPLVHQTTIPIPSTNFPRNDVIRIDSGLNVDRTNEDGLGKDSVITEHPATTTEMEPVSDISAKEWDTFFEEDLVFLDAVSTEYPTAPQHISKKFEMPEQQTEESMILENVPNTFAAGVFHYASSTTLSPEVDESTSNPPVKNPLSYPESSGPIAEVTKDNFDNVVAEGQAITTTKYDSAFIEPEEYLEKDDGVHLSTEVPESNLEDDATEMVFVAETSSVTIPVSLTTNSLKETRPERIEFDRPTTDKIMFSHSDTTIKPGKPTDRSEFEEIELAVPAITFESSTTKDEIGQIQFGRSPQDDIIVNQDYRDYNSEYVAGTRGDSATKDFDYASLGMGESIEIGGSFPTEAEQEAYIQDRRQESSAAAPSEPLPGKEWFFGKIHEPPAEGNTEPTLDLSSILSGIDFTKIDFSKLDLSSMDLSGVDLSGLDFSELPSNLNLENFDMSKLPANLNLSSLNLSSLPENLNISGLDLSNINISDVASKIDAEKLNFSKHQFKQRVEAQKQPSSLEFFTNKDSSVPNVNNPSYDDYDTSDFQSSNQPSGFHPNRPPPFLLSNFNFDGSTVNEHFDSSRAPPSVLPSQFHFGPSQSPGFRPPSENFRPFSPGIFGLQQQSSHYSSSDSPQFYIVDNFGNGEFIDPSAINIQDQSRYQEDTIADPNHPRKPDFNIHQQSRFGDPNRQQQRVPSVETAHNVQFVHDIQHSNQDQASVRPTRNPSIGLADLDLGKLAGNLNLGEQDFSKLDLSQLPSNLDLSALDFSSIPSNFSLGGLDISKIAGSLDLGSIDLSNINMKGLDIPNILRQLSPGRTPSSRPHINKGKSITRQGFAIRNFDKDANSFSDVISKKTNRSFDAPVKPEALPGSEQWVTEAEADQHLVDELGITHLVKMARALSFDGNGNVDFLLCTMCKTGVVTGQKLMNDLEKTDKEIKSLVIYICIQFELFPGDVCRGMINIVGDEILHVLRAFAHPPEIFCGMMLNNQCDDAPLPSWELQLPALKSPKPVPTTPPASGDLKILHISDLHLDSEYVEGTDADCGYPLCCRDWQLRRDGGLDIANKTKSAMDMIAMKVMADADDPNMDAKSELMSSFKFPTAAGKWGAFGRCDLPMRTIDNLLEAGAAFKPDIVYVTGDLPAHDVWQQTRESVKQSIAVTSERIRAAFPDTPVVMTVGNHEIVPINSFPVPEVYGLGYNPSWLYESLALQWQGWVPLTSMDTLKMGGYYSVSPRQGLRVLSVNGNYCNSKNWWLMLAHRDPTSQLEWLEYQLSAAESAGEKVHILSHIPPGNPDCEQSWSRQFARIVSRHAATVTGVFSGHQHLDQWQVIYDPEDNSRAVGVTYIAPSATTFREHSPSFRMFTVDGKRPEATWTIVDHATYTANLTEANKPGNSPHYAQRYTAREAFDMADLSPSSWADVVSRMAVNQTMFNDHMRFKHNYWAEPTEITDCDLTCKTRSLCFLLTGDSSNNESCERLKPNVTIA